MTSRSKSILKDVSGAASLLTVLVLSILLTVIVTGLLRLSIVDSRESVDDDLSNRAFFAAESGINNVAAYLEDGAIDPADPDLQSCQPLGTVGAEVQLGASDIDVAITCELIDLEPEDIEADIDLNGSFTVPLDFVAGANPSELIVRWHNLDAEPAGDGDSPQFRNNEEFPSQAGWDSGRYPAVMRMTLINRPAGNSIDLDDVQAWSVFLIPGATGTAGPISAAAQDGEPLRVSCSTANEYACSVNITIPNGENTLKLQPLYSDAQVEISTNSGASFEGVQAVADVTARAGDVFRRIQANIDLTGGSALVNEISPIPDAAVTSGEGICKLITLAATPQDGCTNLPADIQ